MVTQTISTDTTKYVRSIEKSLRKLDKRSHRAMNLIAEAGKRAAFDLAPKDTKRTARAIKINKANRERKVAVVIAGNGHPYNTWNGAPFNLTYWMHTSDRALSHPWRTGTPRFMYEANEVLERELGRKMRWMINALVDREML